MRIHLGIFTLTIVGLVAATGCDRSRPLPTPQPSPFDDIPQDYDHSSDPVPDGHDTERGYSPPNWQPPVLFQTPVPDMPMARVSCTLKGTCAADPTFENVNLDLAFTVPEAIAGTMQKSCVDGAREAAKQCDLSKVDVRAVIEPENGAPSVYGTTFRGPVSCSGRLLNCFRDPKINGRSFTPSANPNLAYTRDSLQACQGFFQNYAERCSRHDLTPELLTTAVFSYLPANVTNRTVKAKPTKK